MADQVEGQSGVQPFEEDTGSFQLDFDQTAQDAANPIQETDADSQTARISTDLQPNNDFGNESVSSMPPPPRRSTRVRKPSRAWLEHMQAHMLFVNAVGIAIEDAESSPSRNLTPQDVGYVPDSWQDAISCIERDKWLAASHKELQQHLRNGT